MIPVRTKIGCIKKCNYCVVPQYDSFSVRENIEIINELSNYKNINDHKRFFFADSEINFPNNIWLMELLKDIINVFGENEISWEGYLYPILKDFKILAPIIKQSGCNQINLTVDSLDDNILRNTCKDYTFNDVLEIIGILHQTNIRTRLNILFGNLGENHDTLKKQIDIIKNLSKNGIKTTINAGIRIYPNTPLSIQALSQSELCTLTPESHIFCSPVPYQVLGHTLFNEFYSDDNVTFTEERDLNYEKYCKYLFIGAVNLERKNYKKSEIAFKKALSFNIETYRAKLGLARNYFESCNFNKAELIIKEIEQ